MKDGLNIKDVGNGNYEIVRTLGEVVTKEDVEARLSELVSHENDLSEYLEIFDKDFEKQKEQKRKELEMELEKIRSNIAVVSDALEKGEGNGSLE